MAEAVATLVPRDAADVVERDLDVSCRRLEHVFRRMAGKRVVLTGGAGFLGYYAVQAIAYWNRTAAKSDRIGVTIVDNFVRGMPPWLDAFGAGELRLLAHDVTEPLPLDAGAAEYVIHAASIASPTFYRRHPIETMDANVTGLRLLLERARSQQDRGQAVDGFLFFSSSEIYGDPEPDAIPTRETYPGRVSSTGPRACYDESKRYGETLCVNFARQYGLPITIVRPFNNYGPGLKISDRRVIPDFARCILEGRDVVLHSNGSPTRTFCYVADSIVGYYKVLVEGRAGEAYNIGSDGPEITMTELAERLAAAGRELFQATSRVRYEPSGDEQYLVDNPQRRCPDIAKARQELGFAPQIDLDAGLRRTLIWYAGHREGQES